MGKISYISIFILIFYLNQIFCDDDPTYNKPIGYKCSSNLECNSACCSSDKCSDSSKCEKLVRTVYICEAALCLVFIIAFTIYLIIKLKRIKEDFKKKTSEDDNKLKQLENSKNNNLSNDQNNHKEN